MPLAKPNLEDSEPERMKNIGDVLRQIVDILRRQAFSGLFAEYLEDLASTQTVESLESSYSLHA
jgi:hypothetical protein